MKYSDKHIAASGTLQTEERQLEQVVVTYHRPVLLKESIEGLALKKGGNYADLTFGGGGHSREILRRLHELGGGHLYSFDQDADAVQNVSEEMQADECFTFVRGNFRYLRNFLRWEGCEGVDGILADLGVSSHHFDDAERGFSFRFDAPLDMRMNRNAHLTAAQVVNQYSEERLSDVFYLYGELRQSRRLAASIVKKRLQQPLETTGQLAELVGADDKKTLAKVFQALRIEVNQEMTALECMLRQSIEVLRPGGRLVIITYHSLEDRMVKNLIRTGNVEGRAEKDFYGCVSTPLKSVSKGVVTPSAEEQAENPRSRSAKLRIAARIEDK